MTTPASIEVEAGYFRRIVGAHLGDYNILLLECGHEIATTERVGAGVKLCLACGRGEPPIHVTGDYWERWCELQLAKERSA